MAEKELDRPVPAPAVPATRIQTMTRALILDAALDIFSRHGLRGSTVDEIAARAGMSKANLLYYYRRKQDLYEAVLERTLADWLQPLEELTVEGDPAEELRRYITAKLALSAERPEASRLFANEIIAGAPVMMPSLETTLRDLVSKKTAVIRAWIAQGRLAPVDPVHLIFAIWATTQHYADFDAQIRAILGPKAESPDFRSSVTQSVLAIILDGVRPR
ncbi:TetR family transcriptional regulator C-terminal domain-containing protein [Aureimonas phyllosphaerae]|uniref:TetR/AcrR family transcriptional regulator n=1 Tax=Aureimonas phyllosphaerae TaxID=1166078 RepID=A0A7W6BLP7_9HYPH|nr:TetR family transcriptional regulator C-terminal domain-containing protein [Aureimonas phyllosphaerae]MBB3934176.1 TetR/AcrR family transcriptional regulator [Aureimonas phyllosphaerae]MBB3958608.1 TetR/AcrR family transcriptional regulator [Aureimonas phyllosphaerae]